MTLTLAQLEGIVVAAFLAGVGAAYICHAIIRAALGIPLFDPAPELVEASRSREPAPARRIPARARFATPLPAVAVSPAEWARRSFDDPSRVRLAITLGAPL